MKNSDEKSVRMTNRVKGVAPPKKTPLIEQKSVTLYT